MLEKAAKGKYDHWTDEILPKERWSHRSGEELLELLEFPEVDFIDS